MGTAYSSFQRVIGFGSDNVLDYSLVTAKGELIHANENENADLFWGMRGSGGGNFGFVVEQKIRLFLAEPEYLHGEIGYLVALAGREVVDPVIREYAKFIQEMPDELSVKIIFVDRGVLLVAYTWCGSDIELGLQWVDTLRQRLPSPFFDTYKRSDFSTMLIEQGGGSEGYPSSRRGYTPADYFVKFSDFLVDNILELMFGSREGLAITLIITPMLGVLAEMPSDYTAFPFRTAGVNVEFSCGWQDASDDDRWISFIHNFRKRLYDNGDAVGTCINHPDQRWSDADYPAMYYSDNYARLQEVKATWDPNNVFNYPQSVRLPSGHEEFNHTYAAK